MDNFQIADLTMIFLELKSIHNELVVRNAYDTGLISETDYKSYLRDQMNLIAKGE